MATINIIIDERNASIGTFTVGRVLPYRLKRMVGPFIYLDHMGPVELSETENFDVLPHPHIGLSTLTYLLDGTIMHRDSIGSAVEIKPGEVNWMTAGKGIVHSERTPEYLRHSDKTMHGLQIWVALPADKEQVDPSFFHGASDQIPQWIDGNLQLKLIAGEAYGRKSPVPVYSKLYLLQITAKSRQVINTGHELFGKLGLYILEGNIKIGNTTCNPRQFAVISNSVNAEFTIEADTTIFIFGGEPFANDQLIDWNFVSSNRNRIEEAKQKWKEQAFDTIAGETEFVPYPDKD
jgi:redox-sensitive bicupin YhaK (pirin superfamily)